MTRLCFPLLLLVFTTEAAAQTTAIRLTLDEAVTRGLETSHRLADMNARADAARALEDQRAAARRPQAALTASYARTNHVDEFSVPTAAGGLRVIYPDIPDNMRSRVDLQWPIYTGGRLDALERAASADVDAALLDRDAARADLKLEITRAFWAVVTARASRDVVAQAVERTAAHLTDVRNQLAVGLVPPSDVLAIEAQLAHQQMLAIDAETLVETTAADFRRLVGLDPHARFELAADLAAMQPPREEHLAVAPPALASLFDTARANRPERQALEFRMTAAGDRAAAARAGTLPVLTTIAGYDFARPNPRIFPIQERWRPSWDIGVSLRWSLFDGGRTSAETAEVLAQRRSLEARIRELDAGVQGEVRQRLAELRAARASIEAADLGVRAATEARRVLGERFAAGVATNTDVLNAQVALLQAELDRTRARAALQLAGARLDRALGRP